MCHSDLQGGLDPKLQLPHLFPPLHSYADYASPRLLWANDWGQHGYLSRQCREIRVFQQTLAQGFFFILDKFLLEPCCIQESFSQHSFPAPLSQVSDRCYGINTLPAPSYSKCFPCLILSLYLQLSGPKLMQMVLRYLRKQMAKRRLWTWSFTA